MLNEKTRVSVSIASLLIAVGVIITTVSAFADYKADVEVSIQSLERETIHLAETDLTIEVEQQTNRAILQGNQTDLAVIKTDLQWIRAYLEKGK